MALVSILGRSRWGITINWHRGSTRAGRRRVSGTIAVISVQRFSRDRKKNVRYNRTGRPRVDSWLTESECVASTLSSKSKWRVFAKPKYPNIRRHTKNMEPTNGARRTYHSPIISCWICEQWLRLVWTSLRHERVSPVVRDRWCQMRLATSDCGSTILQSKSCSSLP